MSILTHIYIATFHAHRLQSVNRQDEVPIVYHYDQYGRVDSLYDESGVMCYEYGNMGEVTRETRIYALPFLTNALALSTQFTNDSWGRIQEITYPDNEVVNYAYDLGGQLQSITNNSSYTYLDNVTYDRFGAKVSQTYGNGLVTNYSYNNLTRRLSTIATMNGNSQLSSFAYTYDNVGNVTQVTSSCPWRHNQNFTETFTYDAADQLTAAQSVVNGQSSVSNYQLAVTYGNWGKINSYSLAQTDLQNNNTQSEAQAYTYPVTNSIGNSQTLFAPQQRTITDANNNVATETLTFGINGSLRKRAVQAQPQASYTEYYLFNSAANLKAYSNNGLDFAYYGYNAANTRSYKLSMLNQNQWVNGQPCPIRLQLQNAMFYPNAYLNFNQNGEYTKHYYNGSERIASRLGSSTQPTDATSNDRLNYRLMRAEEKFRENIQELVSEWHPVDLHGSVDLVALQPTGTATDIFYYHTNHLGSTAFVTDQNQNINQGFHYAPFGEITTEYAPLWQNGTLPKYSFNAKELDEETGMYYYEARYYKPPVFTSRDPMFEKYFWMTPYAYCANNPVKYVDPDGNKIRGFSIDDDGNVHINYEKASKDAVRIYEAMSKTETGAGSFKGMIKSETEITLFLTDDALFDENGVQAHAITDADINDLTENGEYKKAVITISTAELVSGEMDRYSGFSDEEKINGIGTHESGHLDPDQIIIDYLSMSLRRKEQYPVMLEYKSRLEYRQKYGKEGDADINPFYRKYLFKRNLKKLGVHM